MMCAGCGFDMQGQPIPRCPECGALRGFTVSLDELGLTEDQIRSGFQGQREQANNGVKIADRTASHDLMQ